jgi:hypothetical protein
MNRMFCRRNKNQTALHSYSLIVKRCLLFLSFSLAVISMQAQSKPTAEVKGVVKDESGELLTGATIMVRDTKQVTTSGKDGSFVLKNVPSEATLRISFVGYIVKEIKLRQGQVIVEIA